MLTITRAQRKGKDSMRSFVATFAMAGSMLWALPGTVSAAQHDSASGKGIYHAGAEEYEFSFKARSGPSGEDPKGTMILERTDGAFSARADIYCMFVSENLTTIVGTITETVGFEGYQELVFKVQDNAGLSAADRFVHIVTDVGEVECYVETPAFPIDDGDIDVVDSPPRPPKEDSTVGDGVGVGEFAFSFEASSGPSGEKP